MINKISILIYEKDKILNSILNYQISTYNNYEVFSVNDYDEFYETINEKNFDIFILNLINFNFDLKNLVDIYQDKNKQSNIIGYHDTDPKILPKKLSSLILLKKPFKLKKLFKQIDSINEIDTRDNSIKTLMNHIIFSPTKKIISNLETKNIEHLTEKENNLLVYFYNKKNVEVLKRDLLTNIWGVSDEINTHTLETHIYRLKQKLYKLDPNLSFSLINKNGLYCLKYNDENLKT